MMMNKVKGRDFTIGGGSPLVLMAGPCVLEEMERCLLIGRTIKEITARLGIPYIFKASFDKANRSSFNSFRGPGLKKGLEMLQAIKEELDVPVVTDVHKESRVCAARPTSATRRQSPAAASTSRRRSFSRRATWATSSTSCTRAAAPTSS